MHEDEIGPARVFDGNILFLPHELQSKVGTKRYGDMSTVLLCLL